MDEHEAKGSKIRSYRDYRRLIRHQTSSSLREMYDAKYFEKHVGDKHLADAYFTSKGLAPTEYTTRPLELADVKPGHRVLDVGCGRGEIVFQTAAIGATAVGVDYADAALAIAKATQKKHSVEIRDHTTFLQADATELPFDDATFDRLFLLDVVEHLAPAELLQTLREVRRVLSPDGRLVVHTSPNVWTRTYGYDIARVLAFLARRPRPQHPVVASYEELTRDPDYDPEKILLHINEQSALSLKLALLRAGLKSRVWLQSPGTIFRERSGFSGWGLSMLYRLLGLKFLFGSDLYAVAEPR